MRVCTNQALFFFPHTPTHTHTHTHTPSLLKGANLSFPAARVVRNPLYHSGLVILPPDEVDVRLLYRGWGREEEEEGGVLHCLPRHVLVFESSQTLFALCLRFADMTNY